MVKYRVQVSWMRPSEKKEPYHVYENISDLLFHEKYLLLFRTNKAPIQISIDEYISVRVEKMEVV